MTDLLLVGATGLVGQAVLRQALADSRVTKVVAVTRNPLPPQPRLENPLVDFDALPGEASWWKVNAGICTLGTTMRQAGSHGAFRKVDVDYPLAVGCGHRGSLARARHIAPGKRAPSGCFTLCGRCCRVTIVWSPQTR
jgi:hypothetical protein